MPSLDDNQIVVNIHEIIGRAQANSNFYELQFYLQYDEQCLLVDMGT